MAAEPEFRIPVLTDEVTEVTDVAAGDSAVARAGGEEAEAASPAGGLSEAERQALIAELQTELAASTFMLTDRIMRSAFAQMEANVFAQISGRLRAELPEIIDSALRERLGDDSDD